MKQRKQYVIPVAGLDRGLYQYEFDIDQTFFEFFGASEIGQCRIKISLQLIKQDDAIVLEFNQKGVMELQCDRCLGQFEMPVEGTDQVILKYGDENGQAGQDEEIIAPYQQEIDVRQYIYDYVNLKIPFRKVHPDNAQGESGCDAEVIKKIEELSNNNDLDPRWDQLKQINKKN